MSTAGPQIGRVLGWLTHCLSTDEYLRRERRPGPGAAQGPQSACRMWGRKPGVESVPRGPLSRSQLLDRHPESSAWWCRSWLEAWDGRGRLPFCEWALAAD